MRLKQKKIAFLGVGRMGEGLIQGLIQAKIFPPKNIIAADKEPQRLSYMQKTYKVRTEADNVKASTGMDIIVLAVKPQVMKEVLTEISSFIKPTQLILSIAAGITLRSIEKVIPQAPVVRVMPNTPCLIGEGITALCKGRIASDKDLKLAERLFRAVGQTVVVEEKLMDAVTGLSGSGPAFVYTVIEALMEAGIQAGLSQGTAKTLALQTVLGAAQTIVETGRSPAELRNMVTSPGGTTVEGLKVLEEGKLKVTLIDAVLAATERSKELSEQYQAGEK